MADAPPPSPPGAALGDPAVCMRLQLTRAALGPVSPANESMMRPQPHWSELRADLEREDLDAEIAGAEGDLARGDDSAALRLRALRSLRAMRSFERGDRGAAYDEWEALAGEDPEDIDPLLTRSTFFSASDDLDTALDDLSRAAARAPRDPEVYLRRGRVFVCRDDWERALSDFRRLVHLRPRSLDAIDLLAK